MPLSHTFNLKQTNVKDKPDMKNFLFATAAALALFAAPAFAGSTENITGCATVPVQGSNFTVRLDPNCALSNDKGDGNNLLGAAGVQVVYDLVNPAPVSP